MTATATLKHFGVVYSISVSDPEGLTQAKSEIWRLFEQEVANPNPRRFFLVVDGNAFPIKTEEEYDFWVVYVEEYQPERQALGKVVTITVLADS